MGASVTPGKEARAMTSFANALRQLPSIIAENGGYDSAQLVSELKAKHILGESTMGLNMTEGKVGCMQELGITESFSVKRQVLVQASEAAEMILRVDDILLVTGDHAHYVEVPPRNLPAQVYF